MISLLCSVEAMPAAPVGRLCSLKERDDQVCRLVTHQPAATRLHSLQQRQEDAGSALNHPPNTITPAPEALAVLHCSSSSQSTYLMTPLP